MQRKCAVRRYLRDLQKKFDPVMINAPKTSSNPSEKAC